MTKPLPPQPRPFLPALNSATKQVFLEHDASVEHAVYWPNLGFIAPGASTHPQAGGHMHYQALQHQLPHPALDVIASHRSPTAQRWSPFDEVHSTVTSAGDAFKSLFLAHDWVGATGVLESLSASLALIRQTAQRSERIAGVAGTNSASELEKFAVETLQALGWVRSAFAMGACHYHDPSADSRWWRCAMRFQERTDAATLEKIVEHYAQFFHVPMWRAEMFKAALVHVSWLTPDWPSVGWQTHQTQEQRLADAMKKLSDSLLAAYNDLKESPIEEAAFRADLVSAVFPAFCSPLLAPELAKLPAFQLCGDGMAMNLACIVNWKGAQLFPLEPKFARGNVKEAQQPPVPALENPAVAAVQFRIPAQPADTAMHDDWFDALDWN